MKNSAKYAIHLDEEGRLVDFQINGVSGQEREYKSLQSKITERIWSLGSDPENGDGIELVRVEEGGRSFTCFHFFCMMICVG